MNERPCPCGSGRPLGACCGPYIAGAPAPTAEALMRSRYSAYVLGEADYLLQSWSAATRPEQIDTDAGPQWLGLEIRTLSGGGAEDNEGTVEFVARYRDGARSGALHETSRFVREAGHWVYVDGTLHPAPETKPGRNVPCPCGSGKKYKRCCGR